MLEAGYIFCHRCGYSTDEAYYYNDPQTTWVQLKRSLNGKIIVEPYIPQYMMGTLSDEDTKNIDRFVLSDSNNSFENGLPHTILVDCYSEHGKAQLKFNRSCPFCVGQQEGWDSVKELIPDINTLPTYVIAVIGERTVGKSCWIHALSCPHNLNKVNNQRIGGTDNSGYILTAKTLADESSARPEATSINELGNTRVMTITKSSEAAVTPVAQILILDFPGEIFAESKAEEFNNTAAHIFSGGHGYKGVDAIIFLMDPDEVDSKADETEKAGAADLKSSDELKFSIATTYNRINNELQLLTNRPFAFVMNKIDKLFDHPSNFVHVNNDASQPDIPLLTEHTFANQNNSMYQKRSILPRVALETSILKRFSQIVETVSSTTRCAGFMIKATTPLQGDGKKAMLLDFTSSINVMDPLLWILNELDIFPIDDNVK